MELTKQLELLKQLCEIDGVSGGEEKVADWLKNHLPEDCKVRTDALGNLICEKKGKQTPKNKLLFSAHMDEVGFIITYIEESGLLRFSSMGGIDTRVVVGKPVRLESGALGVVGAKPIHLQSASDRETVLSYDQLYIDIGAKTARTHCNLLSRATLQPSVRPLLRWAAASVQRHWTTASAACCCWTCSVSRWNTM